MSRYTPPCHAMHVLVEEEAWTPCAVSQIQSVYTYVKIVVNDGLCALKVTGYHRECNNS